MEKKLVCNPTKQLEDYPKEVIIKVFYRSIVFFNTDKFVAECEIIHTEIQFQKLMERAEELSKQTKILLTNEPQKGDWERLAVWLDEIKKINKEQDRIHIKIDKLLDYK